MISTLRVNNGSFASATVNIQPDSASTDGTVDNPVKFQASVQQQTEKTQDTMNSTSVPVRQAQVPMTVIRSAGTDVVASKGPTLQEMVDSVSDSGFIVPPYHGSNNIMPTHALNLDAGRVYDPRLTQGFVNTTTKFQPYESLTGIAQERPEIVMLTNYQPLYNEDTHKSAPQFIGALEQAGLQQTKTSSGYYLDAQFNMKSLAVFNTRQTVSSIRNRYVNIDQTIKTKASDFSKAIVALKDDASFLLNLTKIIESQKSQLDLRHDLYTVVPPEVVSYFLQNFSQKRLSDSPSEAPHVLTQIVQQGSKKQFSVSDCLADLGYTPDSIKNVFSSTKIWLQILQELKSALQHHTLKLLDIDPSYQRNDKNPSTILKSSVKLFDVASNLPQLPTLDELIKLQVSGLPQVMNVLQPAYLSIYQNVFFKNDEARIAALSHLLSKEYRYSAGLADDTFVRQLGSYYGFKVTTSGNSTFLESVLGVLNNNITDFSATALSSLATVAQQRNGSTGILTFETKYVDGDTGTLTPGGDYYFDRILDTTGQKFDTTAIDALSELLQTQADNFSVVCDALNLFAIPAKTLGTRNDTTTSSDVHFLDSSTDLVHQLTTQLINPKSGEPNRVSSNDRLSSVFVQARKDNNIKTSLFLYTLAKISRTYTNNVQFFSSPSTGDNTPLVDNIIDNLIVNLEASVPETRSTVQLVTQSGLDKGVNTSSLTNDSIKHALKSGTDLTAMIEKFMSDVLTQFRVKSSAITTNFTRYNGYLDTIVMMMAFDLVISIVARYSNQALVGVHKGLTAFSQGQTTYAVSQTSTNYLSSFNELIQKLATEGNLTREMIMTVLNGLRKLSGSLKGVSNYLNSTVAVDKLHEIAFALNNDPQMIKLLLSEQQIMLLASTVENLATASSAANSSVKAQSYNKDNQTADKEISILDESEVSPELYQAVQGYFGSGELATIEATNKRIVTVGIPLGFTQKIKQRVSIQKQNKASFADKQSDMVRICVYKTDLQNPDVVYRPLRFLFEMSRFPTRFGTSTWLKLPTNPSLNDVINCIPTQNLSRDLSNTSNSITAGVEYASTAVADSDGIRGARAAFSDPTYAFLQPQQKTEILHNHVVSQLLESYVKLMTGINVSEYSYHMVEPPSQVDPILIKSIMDHTVAHVADRTSTQKQTSMAQESMPPTGGVLFSSTSTKKVAGVSGTNVSKSISQPILSNPSGVAGTISDAAQFRSMQPSSTTTKSLEQTKIIGSAASNLDQLSTKDMSVMVANVRAISNLSSMFSTISTVPALNHRVLSPKQFDRVFSVMIDSRDFEIDVKKTTTTPYGKQAFMLMLQNGDIVTTDQDSGARKLEKMGSSRRNLTSNASSGRSFPQGRQSKDVDNFQYRERDKNAGDLIADKYFVTIETFGDEV